MKSKTRQTFELSDDDVRLAVTEFVERKYGKKGKSPIVVSIDVRTRTIGIGMNERDESYVAVTATREA